MNIFSIKQFAVFIIILLGLALFVAITFITGQNKGTLFKPMNFHTSIFSEARGVEVGTEVTIHGVRTGNVTGIRILKDGDVRVTFSSAKKHSFMVNKSSTAQLKVQGALGDRYVAIFTRDLEADPLAENESIPTKASIDLMDLLSGSSNNKKSIQHILDELTHFAESINENILSKKNGRDLREILILTRNVLRKIDGGEGSLGALVNNPSLYRRLLLLLGKKPNNYMKDISRESSNKNKKKK